MKTCLLLASLISFFSAAPADTGKHSHYFYITITSSGYNYPSYYTTRSIDDITLYWYDSVSEVIERRVPWFRSPYATLLDASFNQLMIQRRMENLFRMFQNFLNETGGFHILQRLQGCTLYDNGTIDTVFSYRYDGKPFLTFVVENAHWIAEDSRVKSVADIFNQNKTLGEKNRDVLLNTCVPHITELLSLGDNCTFHRREQPVVRVTQRPVTNSTSRLSCQAYGHYPKNISMTWYRNGEAVPESLMERVTLPLPQITYLTWVALNVTLTKEDVYTCIVDHVSMASPFRQDWITLEESTEPSSRGLSNGVIIATCLAVVLLAVLIAFGSVSIGKSRRQLPLTLSHDH